LLVSLSQDTDPNASRRASSHWAATAVKVALLYFFSNRPPVDAAVR